VPSLAEVKRVLVLGISSASVSEIVRTQTTILRDNKILGQDPRFVVIDGYLATQEELEHAIEQVDAILIDCYLLYGLVGFGVDRMPIALSDEKIGRQRTMLKKFLKQTQKLKVGMVVDHGPRSFRGGIAGLGKFLREVNISLLLSRFLRNDFMRSLLAFMLGAKQSSGPDSFKFRVSILPIHSNISLADEMKLDDYSSRPFDLCLYGQTQREIYPMRVRLYSLFERDPELRTLVAKRGVGFVAQDGKQETLVINGTHEESLAKALRLCKAGVATPGYMKYFLGKFHEIPAHGAAIVGELPLDGLMVYSLGVEILGFQYADLDEDILRRTKEFLKSPAAWLKSVVAARKALATHLSLDVFADHVFSAMVNSSYSPIPPYLCYRDSSKEVEINPLELLQNGLMNDLKHLSED
jgi:hypothetical protein